MTPYRRDAETAWKAGDKLTWSGERWTFWQFDPDYPRAICQSDALRVCAIDITTAKRVDAATERKRAERLRRKEAGEVRIEAWIDADVRNRLVAGCHRSGVSLARGIEMMVNDKWPVHLTRCNHCADLGLRGCMIDHGENE